MKTLEQTILEASNPHYGIMGEKTKAIASAVREWMKEQNEGLRNIIDTKIATLQAEQPAGIYTINHNATRNTLVDAILSVIPPRMVYDPRPLQAEIDGWKTAARIVELEDQLKQEIWQHAACLTIAETGEKWGKNVQPSAAMMAVYDLKQDYQRLDLEFRTLKNAHKRLADECGNYHKGDRSSSKFTEIKALLDKLRPIRKEQESRIIHARTYIMDHDYGGAISTLSDFLEEMQKAKAIHAEIDSIIEQSQISQMEEQRKEFDNDVPFPDETIEALKEFTKRSSEAYDWAVQNGRR